MHSVRLNINSCIGFVEEYGIDALRKDFHRTSASRGSYVDWDRMHGDNEKQKRLHHWCAVKTVTSNCSKLLLATGL